jgi:rod shape-determining protein MreD
VRFRHLNLGLAFAIAAVILQTTLFDRYLNPFGVAPDFVLLMVVAAAFQLSEEAAMLLGFSAGLLTDLLGNTLLGVWALVLTVAGYVAVRIRPRVEGNPFLTLVSVFALTLGGELLFAVLGTLFGQQVFSDVNAIKKVLLAAVYNLILAVLVLPLAARLMRRDPAAGVWT